MAAGNRRSDSRVFKSGNAQAVRIPRELADDEVGQEVDIERRGNMLLVRRPIEKNRLALPVYSPCSARISGLMAVNSMSRKNAAGATSMKYMLDTKACIYLILKPSPDALESSSQG